MQLKEEREKRAMDAQSKLEGVSDKITELENVEMEMLSNLRNTVNEHQKLLEMAKGGKLDLNSIMASQQRFNGPKNGKWR